jgi:uncharacterized tellurite resistance protein B-like protein
METPNTELQEAFGKVIYAVAKIDGEVQQVEIDVFREVINNHEWANSITLSFDREYELDRNANIVFLKAMKIFRFNGQSEHYPFFIDLLEQIALAHDGVVPEERRMIERFKQGLLAGINKQ